MGKSAESTDGGQHVRVACGNYLTCCSGFASIAATPRLRRRLQIWNKVSMPSLLKIRHAALNHGTDNEDVQTIYPPF